MQKRVDGTFALQGARAGALRAGTLSAPVPGRRGGLLSPLSLLVALAVGMGAVVLGNWARFHLQMLPPEIAGGDLEMATSIGVGLALAVLLRIVFRLQGKLQTACILAGVTAMTLGFHNLPHWFPEASALAFSPDYAAQVRGATPENSLLFRGEFIPFALERRIASVSCAVAGQAGSCQ